MQSIVETFESRRAECITMMQMIPAKYINPYRKSLEEMISDATEAKRRFFKTNSLFNLNKGNLKPYLGYPWLPDGDREVIDTWRS